MLPSAKRLVVDDDTPRPYVVCVTASVAVLVVVGVAVAIVVGVDVGGWITTALGSARRVGVEMAMDVGVGVLVLMISSGSEGS